MYFFLKPWHLHTALYRVAVRNASAVIDLCTLFFYTAAFFVLEHVHLLARYGEHVHLLARYGDHVHLLARYGDHVYLLARYGKCDI